MRVKDTVNFYLGLHLPSHAWRFARTMLSANLLERRKSDFRPSEKERTHEMNDKRPPSFRDLLEVIRYVWRGHAPSKWGLSAVIIGTQAYGTVGFDSDQSKVICLLFIGFVLLIFLNTPWPGGK